MTSPERIPVFDGHNDTLTCMRDLDGAPVEAFLRGREVGHIDLPRAREGGLAGGMFAIFTASHGWTKVLRPLHAPDGSVIEGGFAVEPPPRLSRRTALRHTLSVVSDLLRLERASEGAIAVARTADEIRRCRQSGILAAVLHIEGAECLDPKRLETLDVLYAAGLRSLGLVWSRPNAFAHGVPFDFPRGPDTGPGLTRAGRALVGACVRMGIMVDLSHLNEAGFWEVSQISSAPLVASHSNAWALSRSPRNLTDRQLDAVGASGGLVGINFHRGFLREDGRWQEETSYHQIVRHVRYVADRIGIAHVGLGSDFDGATMPSDLPDVTALPHLLDALAAAGFSASDVRAVAHENWERVLGVTWGG